MSRKQDVAKPADVSFPIQWIQDSLRNWCKLYATKRQRRYLQDTLILLYVLTGDVCEYNDFEY